MGATLAAGRADDGTNGNNGTNGASIALPTAVHAQNAEEIPEVAASGGAATAPGGKPSASVPNGRRGVRVKTNNAPAADVRASASAGADTAAVGGGDADDAGGNRKPRGKPVSRTRMKQAPNPPDTAS